VRSEATSPALSSLLVDRLGHCRHFSSTALVCRHFSSTAWGTVVTSRRPPWSVVTSCRPTGPVVTSRRPPLGLSSLLVDRRVLSSDRADRPGPVVRSSRPGLARSSNSDDRIGPVACRRFLTTGPGRSPGHRGRVPTTGPDASSFSDDRPEFRPRVGWPAS
jgi:hypothetical protein